MSNKLKALQYNCRAFLSLFRPLKVSFTVLVITILSCESDTVYEAQEMIEGVSVDNQVKFDKIGSKEFEVDSLSDYIMVVPQIYNHLDHQYLIRLDMSGNDLEIYDYDSSKFLKRVRYNTQGPNSVNGNIVGFQMFGFDTLFLMDEVSRLILSDTTGEVYSVYNLFNNNTGMPWLKASTIPAVKNFESITLFQYPIINKGRPLIRSYNFQDNEEVFLGTVPDEHIEGFWGLGDFSWYSTVIRNGEYITNYPNLDSLYIYDVGGNLKDKVFAGSKRIKHPIMPLITNVNKSAIPPQDILNKIHLLRPIYARLFYHPSKQVFYRIVGKPVNEIKVFDVQSELNREYYVIVLDEEFNWLGEFEFNSNEYIINNDLLFMSEEGMNLQKKSNDEDVAEFDIWSIN